MEPEGTELTALRRRLYDLKRRVRTNERIWTAFRRIELDAIGTGNLHGLLETLATGIRGTFPGIHFISVSCLDLDYQLSRLLADCPARRAGSAELVLVTPEQLHGVFPEPRPRCLLGSCDEALARLVFPGSWRDIESAAMAPMLVGGKLVGSLNQGSRDRDHFDPRDGTELIEHLASVIAMCLQNVVGQARLEQHGLTDPLTQIANRRMFDRRLAEEVDRWRRHRHPFTCIMLDIDHFKRINDRYGHAFGDHVLLQVAAALQRCLRPSDLLARYGGEEFVLLLPDTTLDAGMRLAERLRKEIFEMQVESPDRDTAGLGVTVSLGVAALGVPAGLSPDADPGDWLVGAADDALYAAKARGRNRVVAATQSRRRFLETEQEGPS